MDPPEAACPPGMVMVGGSGTIGLDLSTYAVVPHGLVQTEQICTSSEDCQEGYICDSDPESVDAPKLCKAEVPESLCEAALAAHPEASACWVQTNEVDPVVRMHEVTLAPYCIESMPFPGEGSVYTEDGMTAWDAQVLSDLLDSGRYGTRRMCSFTEFEAAVAGLDANRAFIYGNTRRPSRCGAGQAIGADSDCKNSETGVHEYGAIQSHWVRADADFMSAACDDIPCKGAGNLDLEEGHLVVAGGTNRLQTRQAPLTPHTWHDHGHPNPEGCDDMGHDDQPVICADPDPGYAGELPGRLQRVELDWERFRWRAATSKSLGASLEEATGAPVCEL
jgi:hypothetical protein